MTLYTLKETAQRLSVTEDKVRKLVACGALHGVDVSLGTGKRKQWRVSEDGLKSFIEARSMRHTARSTRKVGRATHLSPEHI